MKVTILYDVFIILTYDKVNCTSLQLSRIGTLTFLNCCNYATFSEAATLADEYKFLYTSLLKIKILHTLMDPMVVSEFIIQVFSLRTNTNINIRGRQE